MPFAAAAAVYIYFCCPFTAFLMRTCTEFATVDIPTGTRLFLFYWKMGRKPGGCTASMCFNVLQCGSMCFNVYASPKVVGYRISVLCLLLLILISILVHFLHLRVCVCTPCSLSYPHRAHLATVAVRGRRPLTVRAGRDFKRRGTVSCLLGSFGEEANGLLSW